MAPENRPVKVLAFDSWTKGAHHFAPIAEELSSQGGDFLLIHLGSWGHDKGRPQEEKWGVLTLRDISYYGRIGLDEILVREAADVVVFLSTRALVHQAVNRYALSRGVPTVHMLHGLIHVQSVSMTGNSHKANRRRTASLIWERATKNLTRTIPTYARALLKTRAPLRYWGAMVGEVMHKALSRGGILAPPDATTTAGLVYVAADIPFLRDGYRVPEAAIGVIGNPDLARFGVTDADIGLRQSEAPSDLRRSVIYLDTGLDVAGFVFADARAFSCHLISLQQALRTQGLSLEVKLHPARGDAVLEQRLEEAGIALVLNEGFLPALRTAHAVITEPSTVAMVPAVMGLPLLLARFGALQAQGYGSVLKTYPLSRDLEDPSKLSDLLAEIAENSDRQAFDAWVEDNGGPRPLGAVAQRAAAAIVAVARHGQTTSIGIIGGGDLCLGQNQLQPERRKNARI